MNDTISRQAAIAHAVPLNLFGREVMMVSVSELENLPSAQSEPRWIPCSKRLPEPRIDVWCNSDMGQMVGYYEENVETWYGRDYLELMVTAWMPLPEAYEEESE